MSNKENIQKAIHNISNFTDGLLNPEQATEFIKQLFQNTILKDNARLVGMKSNKRELQKLGLGNRVAMLKQYASIDNARKTTPSKIIMEAKSITTPFAIDDELLDTNIEGKQLENTIIDLMTKRMAVDQQEFLTESDVMAPIVNNPTETGDKIRVGSTTAYTDTFLGSQDGYIKKTESCATVDVANNSISDDVFYGMVQFLPRHFKADRSTLRFLCPSEIEMDYRKNTAVRTTALGDQAKFGYPALTPYGIPLVACDAFPSKFRKTQLVAISATAGQTSALSYAPVQTSPIPVVVDQNALSTLFVEDVDYVINYTTGTITGVAGSLILGTTIKITYYTLPRVILTHSQNLIYGIWRDIKILKDTEIFGDVLLYAIHCSISSAIEENDAIVVAKNVRVS